jgi:predicted transcriptional regulator
MKRLKPTPEMEEQIRQAIAEEEQPEVVAANKTLGGKVLAEIRERQREFADVVTALKEARESRGLSLQDVSDRTGITRASLSLLENGRGNPTMTTLRRVADAIGVEILVTVTAKG